MTTRGWKLWHLSAAVALAALLLAVARLDPRLLALALFTGPLLWATHSWEGRYRKCLGVSVIPSNALEAFLVQMSLFLLLVVSVPVALLGILGLATWAAISLGWVS